MPRGQVSAGPLNPRGAVQGEPPEDIPRDRWQRPLIAPVGSDRAPTALARSELVAYTRASTLGGTLEDQFGLGMWRGRQVAFGLARRRDLVLAAAAVPTTDDPDDKKRLGEIAEQAMEAAESSAKATIGTALHALTERVDRGERIPDIGEDQATLDAYVEAMTAFTVVASEVFTVCDELETAGTFDRLLSPKFSIEAPDGTIIEPGECLIDDLKTAQTADFFGIKFCVQCAPYALGVPYTHANGRMRWQDLGPAARAPRTDWALILHMPSGGSVAEWYWVDLARGLELAHKAIGVRSDRRDKSLIVPADIRPAIRRTGPTGVVPDPVVMTPSRTASAKTILSAIAGARSEAALTALWQTYRATWTQAHTDAVKARLPELRGGAR